MLQQKSTYLVCVIAFSFVLFACKKKGGSDAPPAVVPVIKIEDASQTRTTNDGVMFFTISLNKTTTVPVMEDCAEIFVKIREYNMNKQTFIIIDRNYSINL